MYIERGFGYSCVLTAMKSGEIPYQQTIKYIYGRLPCIPFTSFASRLAPAVHRINPAYNKNSRNNIKQVSYL